MNGHTKLVPGAPDQPAWSRVVATVASILVLGTVVVLLYVSIVDLSPRLAAHDIDESLTDEQAAQLEAGDRLAAVDRARGRLVEGVLGLAVLLSAFVAWRRLRAVEQQVQITTKQLEAAERAALDDRLQKAIELLGSDGVQVQTAGAGIVGGIMRTLANSNDQGAHGLASLLSQVAVDDSREADHSQGSVPPALFRTCVAAFSDLPQPSSHILDLSGADLREWTVELPPRREVYLDRAALAGATLVGFETYVRARQEELVALGNPLLTGVLPELDDD